MADPTPPSNNRSAIRRTAWIAGAVAVASYVLFLVSMMSGK